MKKIEQNQPSTHVNEYRDAGFYRYPDDEISLVDLAKILVHRRWWFFSVFLLTVAIAVGLAWMKATSGGAVVKDKGLVAFTSFVALGYKSPNHFIEPMASVEAQLLHIHRPLLIEQHPEFAGYRVRVNYSERRNLNQDEGSNLISIITLAPKAARDQVQDFHRQLLNPLLETHQELFEALIQQLAQSKTTHTGAQFLPTRLAALAVPAEPAKPKSTLKPSLILALGAVLGGILGIMAAFFAEFVCRVRQSLNEEKV
ncbi:MAG: hypothetical protein IBX50_04455 [Marinospirillum sp.]|uniref:hypothetical protein n=1 Tax=Marinospirillum sp. TaxID=2183934 RepID=UPI001A049785|nr:hypothetical protein [Marinospirillum sp.]MBE0505959.1 hypothetical protein [Marinospirillum sp.]